MPYRLYSMRNNTSGYQLDIHGHRDHKYPRSLTFVLNASFVVVKQSRAIAEEHRKVSYGSRAEPSCRTAASVSTTASKRLFFDR